MASEVEMNLVRVLIHEKIDQQIIHLKEKDGDRSFPIVIGSNEAFEILRKIKGYPTPRPMTHDLLGSIVFATESTIDRIVVSDLRDNTFYATIHLDRGDGKIEEIDARPSDAIALAVQCKSRIFANEDIFARLSEGPF